MLTILTSCTARSSSGRRVDPRNRAQDVPDAAAIAASGNRLTKLRVSSDGPPLFVLRVRFEHELAHTLLGGRVGDGTQQREAATLTIDGILACRERDVAPGTAASFPDGEADQLQTFE